MLTMSVEGLSLGKHREVEEAISRAESMCQEMRPVFRKHEIVQQVCREVTGVTVNQVYGVLRLREQGAQPVLSSDS
jgi:hypothetical protein